MQPSEEFFQLVQTLEKLFNEVHGNELMREGDILQFFCQYVASQKVDVHPKICERFAFARTFIRIKFLNHQLKMGKDSKRHLRKVGHVIA